MTLSGPSGIIKQGEKFNLLYGTRYTSNKKVSGKGRWYFEGTHYESESTLQLFGFSAMADDIYFYYQFSTPVFYDRPNYIPLPISIERDHIVGIGIDTFEGQFYVFNNNSFATYPIVASNFQNDLRVTVVGAASEYTNTTVSVNFGDLPFKYNITAFTPWADSQPYVSCKKLLVRISHEVFLLLLFFE